MRLRGRIFVAALTACSTVISAQDYGDGDDAAVLEEIIVTATRRDKSLQQTSSSVGVLTERDIEDSGVLQIYDYWRMIPSLSVTDRGFAGNRYTIRGMTGSTGNETDESLTANYLDDTLLVSPQDLFTHAPSFRLVDMERVEVLRGPQGTLFGAGSMGGAIRMITNKADVSSSTQSYEAILSNTAHGGVNHGMTAIWNMPVVEDRSALRLVAYRFFDDGFIDDIGSGEDNANSNTTSGFRLGGTAILSDAFSLTAKIAYEDSDADSFAYVDTVGKASVGLNITDDYQNALLIDDFRDEETVLYDLNMDFSTSIGDITSVTSYVETDTDLAIDLSDEMGFFFGSFHPASVQEQFVQKALMQELRIASNSDGKFGWLVGAFYADMEFEKSTVIPAPGINSICGSCTGLPDGEEILVQSAVVDDRRETGLFADISFWFTDRLEANVGARWYDLRRRQTDNSIGFFADPAVPVSSLDISNDGVNGKGALSYHMSDDVMFYLLASQGFRMGGGMTPAEHWRVILHRHLIPTASGITRWVPKHNSLKAD